MTQSTLPSASIVFTAHNRRELLLEAIACAKRQTVPVEILVMDDASTDGTEEAVRSLHPEVRYDRSPTSMGACYQRNKGARLASCDIVFALDDDSILDSPSTVEMTLRDFTGPDIAFVAIPFGEVLISAELNGTTPTDGIEYATNAPQASSQAYRRRAMLEAGGYRELLSYGMEESCLAIRCLDRGGITKAGTADPLRHMAKPGIRPWTNHLFRRNTLIFYFTYAPAIEVPKFLVGAFFNGVVTGLRTRSFASALGGLFAGLGMIMSGKVERQPVDPATFRLHMQLRRRGLIAVDDIRKAIASAGRRAAIAELPSAGR